MSTRDDARLTAQERAALSDLESLASADDPQFAARLRGHRGRGPLSHMRVLRVGAARMPGWLHSAWVGAAAIVAGLGLVVVSLGIAWELGAIGALLAAVGLTSLARHTTRKLSTERPHRS